RVALAVAPVTSPPDEPSDSPRGPSSTAGPQAPAHNASRALMRRALEGVDRTCWVVFICGLRQSRDGPGTGPVAVDGRAWGILHPDEPPCAHAGASRSRTRRFAGWRASGYRWWRGERATSVA